MSTITAHYNDSIKYGDVNFVEYLARQVPANSVSRVLNVLEKLQLPLPTRREEFIAGNEAISIFSSINGVVIRIFDEDAQSFTKANPWVVPSIGLIRVGEALVEICPGELGTDNKEYMGVLKANLFDTGVAFWDTVNGTSNIGLWPIKTEKFPEGIPVVVDKGAVLELPGAEDIPAAKVDEAYDKMGISREEFEEFLQPLKDALSEAALDNYNPAKVKAFWDLCREFVGQNKLVAGWDSDRAPENSHKLEDARISARTYDQKLAFR